MKTEHYDRHDVYTENLQPAEKRLIEYIRKVKWGSVEITVQNSLPVLVKSAIQTTKLNQTTQQ